MTFWRRGPREVYRVYGEEEYLAVEDSRVDGEALLPSVDEQSLPAIADDSSHPPGHPLRAPGHPAHDDAGPGVVHRDEGRHTVVRSPSNGSRAGRLVGLGLLVGVTASVLGLVVVNALHRQSSASRVGAARSARPGAASDAPARGQISARGTVQTSNTPLPRARALARTSPRTATPRRTTTLPTPPARALPYVGVGRPAALSRPEMAVSAPDGESARPEATAQPPDGEFGFER